MKLFKTKRAIRNKVVPIADFKITRPVWPHLHDDIRTDSSGMIVKDAIVKAADYIDSLLWQHSQGEHRDSISGPHPECPGCEIHALAPDVLLREHRGW